MTRVKVCGLTRPDDVRLAAELGAWALGFVLTESPRRVGPGRVAELALQAGLRGRPSETPHIVVVVATESPGWIAGALAESGADAVQLSACADGPSVAAVREAAAHLGRRPVVIAAGDTADAHLADFILLDARAPGAYGGTGTTLDWEALAADPSTPARDVVLAGGLHAYNVGAAAALLHPKAVDVSSGVERAPGVKDYGRLRDFFAAVERADRERPASGAAPGAHTTTRRTTG